MDCNKYKFFAEYLPKIKHIFFVVACKSARDRESSEWAAYVYYPLHYFFVPTRMLMHKLRIKKER